MWNIKSLRNIVGGLVLMLGLFSVSSFGQGPLGQILNRIDAHNKALISLRSDVTMVKYNPQLDVSDTYKGTSIYLPETAKQKMYLRHDWAQPEVEHISVIGDRYELYKPGIKQVYYGKVENAKKGVGIGNALSFMSMKKDQLRANYSTRYLGEEKISGGIVTFHLELTPKNRTSYKSAELWVDGDGMPRQAKIVEHNGDTTTVLLTNIQRNVTIKTDVFKLDYDEDEVKRIKV